eukprot:TRINITY_DN20300_c1_g2_i2.p1 TRINITY_DN20300_c1_g2~~TRINITY_DN20300_c1_g2_i2.p1  ORF type:complete len:375 (+),score=121.68 TRINITY_DN20300_c1_g2_i2:84-1127(+)
MLRAARPLHFRYHQGRMLLDLKLWSTLEPHAEQIQVDAVPVDPEAEGLVLPMHFAGSGDSAQWADAELRRLEPLESREAGQLAALAAAVGAAADAAALSSAPPAGRAAGAPAELCALVRERVAASRLRRSATVHLLKEVFRSWPRLYHQRELERSYPGAGGRIPVLELGPFELTAKGFERPLVLNVQFSEHLPLREDGLPDIRLGADVARRSHYLAPELCEGGLLRPGGGGDVTWNTLAHIGGVPPPQPGRQRAGRGRLYADDAVRFGWAETDGKLAEEPPVPLSRKPDRMADHIAAARSRAGLPAADDPAAARRARQLAIAAAAAPAPAAPTRARQPAQFTGWASV